MLKLVPRKHEKRAGEILETMGITLRKFLLGILFGFLGLLLAVPIVAVVFVAVKMLYVEDVLNRKIEVKGESEAKENQQLQSA